MKYKNKYRIESARRVNWDYGSPVKYFITINVRYHKCLFGKINKGIIELSVTGQIAEQCWLEIPEHFQNVKLDAYVIMPSHVHGILIITESEGKEGSSIVKALNDNSRFLLTPHALKMSRISPKPGSLPVILGSYKSSVTKEIRKFEPKYEWQARYHDHIIRDEREYQRITEYIINNPKNWNDDEFFRKK
ncbi:MAG: hypothetical protein IH594_19570 [Bacteroidales bacterium]|nr:hypothetical protein [Bacteroidales bacterium]